MRYLIIAARTFAGLVFAGTILVLLYQPTPQVWKLWPAGTCVKVIPANAGTCGALPAKYSTVWVSPRYNKVTGAEVTGDRYKL